MKYAPASLAILAASLALPAHAIEFWHSNTVWAGQGQCSAVFTFDSGTEDTKNLQVAVNLLDKAGKKLASGTLEVQQFGQFSANRYADAFLESEETCADDLIITVAKATAIINGKRVDLLKTKTLTTREFKPFKIRVGK
ncbi:hypothetical protein VITFI_CDS2120 [Vitreoscilla filiformis]|uniref:Uncharacterized protein n=1 Tax=Vitreoscilla filiformis TaxID=63 RepID=A0A221KFT9_VITFI|nr:IrmA family protein [Vitreoscilla filiformis]ASM77898.1 hypothetical protein VITFI_CDS2120 [Vitreoscilla filiformis]